MKPAIIPEGVPRRVYSSIVWVFCGLWIVMAAPALCQTASSRALGAGSAAVSGSVLRSPDGRLEIVANPVTGIRVDGALDDEGWQRATPVAGFVQAEPHGGEPATEATEVRVAYDGQNLYIAAYCRDSQPGSLVVNDIREDFKPGDQDSFEVILDTFADRRNGYVFITNPEGARSDLQSSNEGREVNGSWDAVWTVKTRRVDDGWTVEMAIPFRALRFEGGTGRVWGINFSRRIRRKNELDFWSPVPRSYNLYRTSLEGNLAGLSGKRGGRDLRIKPFVLGRTTRPTGGASFDTGGDAGLDVKYGITKGLTLDATVRPDFAQAEADEQQVNLTQFSQFFPEKRDFFLENSGIFYVGDQTRNNRVNPTPTPDEDLLVFFSRRVGLTQAGLPIPLAAGLRLTGRAAGFNLGVLNVQTRRSGTAPANNFTVLRARRNVAAGSDVGALFMTRQSTSQSGDDNRVFGVDGNIRFFRQLDWNSYALKSRTPGVSSGQYAWRTTFNWEGNFFHGKGGVMSIGDGFQNDLGYLRRVGTRKWLADVGIRPRPQALQRLGMREVHPHLTWDYYTDLHNVVTGKRLHSGLTGFMSSGAWAEMSVNQRYEKLDKPFRIHPDVARIPVGSYGWNEYQLKLQTDPSRLMSLTVIGISGGLWSGTQRTVNAAVTVRPSYAFRVTAGLQRTNASLAVPRARFISTIWTARANYSFTTNMYVDLLLQYNRDLHQFNANVRFNLIHHPLSDIFIVVNEQHMATPNAPPSGRGVIVKYNRMFSF